MRKFLILAFVSFLFFASCEESIDNKELNAVEPAASIEFNKLNKNFDAYVSKLSSGVPTVLKNEDYTFTLPELREIEGVTMDGFTLLENKDADGKPTFVAIDNRRKAIFFNTKNESIETEIAAFSDAKNYSDYLQGNETLTEDFAKKVNIPNFTAKKFGFSTKVEKPIYMSEEDLEKISAYSKFEAHSHSCSVENQIQLPFLTKENIPEKESATDLQTRGRTHFPNITWTVNLYTDERRPFHLEVDMRSVRNLIEMWKSITPGFTHKLSRFNYLHSFRNQHIPTYTNLRIRTHRVPGTIYDKKASVTLNKFRKYLSKKKTPKYNHNIHIFATGRTWGRKLGRAGVGRKDGYRAGIATTKYTDLLRGTTLAHEVGHTLALRHEKSIIRMREPHRGKWSRFAFVMHSNTRPFQKYKYRLPWVSRMQLSWARYVLRVSR